MGFGRVIWIVLDSVGIGEMPDAAAYGDKGSDTLGNIARQRHFAFAESVPAGPGEYQAAYGPRRRWPRRRERSASARWRRPARTRPRAIGKWRAFICEKPFPLFPHGFPPRSDGAV